MGDISELRGLIVAGSFIGATVLLISLIPYQFYISDYEGRTIEVPEYFEAIDLQSFAETFNTTLDDTGTPLIVGWLKDVLNEEGEQLGGHEIDLIYADANESIQWINLRHRWSEWIIIPYHHFLTWINPSGISRGESLDPAELDSDYSGSTPEYTAQCTHFQVKCYFGFNETLYSSPSEAYDHYGLNILIGINFDQMATGMNAWNLIGMMLFFQIPEIHWVINALIAIPLWIAIAYISIILLYRSIGAIFGGGA